MEVRQRQDRDLDQLVRVAARVQAVDGYPGFLPDGDLVRFLTRPPPVAAWVAVHDDDLVVGHVALCDRTAGPVMQLAAELEPDERPVFVTRLLVDPGVRRLGYGGRLLERARRAAVALDRAPFLDVVETPGALAALSLYRRDAWEEVGRVPCPVADGRDLEEIVFRGATTEV
jgi:GNAT superfamily N-acetyltransferase